MYAEKPDGKDGMPGTQTGNLNYILNQVGRQLDIPMVNEAQTGPPMAIHLSLS